LRNPARGGRVVFDEESRNPTSDGSTDAVDRAMAYPDESMHGKTQIDTAAEKFVGPKTKWGRTYPPVWDARLGANSQFHARHLERLGDTGRVAMDEHDFLSITRDQALDNRRRQLVTFPRSFPDD
jgi:hypothetical protein